MNTIERTHHFTPSHMPDFPKPLELLKHCHRKIERHLSALEAAVEGLRHSSPDARREALQTIRAAQTHFKIPGAKHTEDEEASLFPRLRANSAEGAREALAAIDELEPQHRAAENLHAEFDRLVERLPRDCPADASDLDELSKRAASLVALYRPHIRVEDDLIFPVAARVLTADDIAALGQEMFARRRVLLGKFLSDKR